jgi:hypothetical protein
MGRIVLTGVTLLVAVLGAWQRHAGGPSLFTLDAEANVPALWSGFLLLLAAVAAVRVARADRRGGAWPWWPLAVLFFFMAADEVAGLHEELERQTGVDWQLLYLPLIAGGGAAALGALVRLREQPALAARFLAACAAWGLAQVLEALQWHGAQRAAGYGEMMVAEETLEMIGSLVFALTLLDFLPPHLGASAGDQAGSADGDGGGDRTAGAGARPRVGVR